MRLISLYCRCRRKINFGSFRDHYLYAKCTCCSLWWGRTIVDNCKVDNVFVSSFILTQEQITFIAEIGVDSTKHAFVTKYNDISSTMYSRFRERLCVILTNNRNPDVSQSQSSEHQTKTRSVLFRQYQFGVQKDRVYRSTIDCAYSCCISAINAICSPSGLNTVTARLCCWILHAICTQSITIHYCCRVRQQKSAIPTTVQGGLNFTLDSKSACFISDRTGVKQDPRSRSLDCP